MKKHLSLTMALIMLLGALTLSTACDQTTPQPQETETTTQGVDTHKDLTLTTTSTPHDTGDETTPTDTQLAPDTNEDMTTMVDPVPEPLRHIIFGAASYTHGIYLIGEVGRDTFPDDVTYPYHPMTIQTLTQWEDFCGGMPKIKMDEAFVAGIEGIDGTFFETKALVPVFVQLASPDDILTIDSLVTSEQDGIQVVITAHQLPSSPQETAYRCVLLPIDKAYAHMEVHVSVEASIETTQLETTP